MNAGANAYCATGVPTKLSVGIAEFPWSRTSGGDGRSIAEVDPRQNRQCWCSRVLGNDEGKMRGVCNRPMLLKKSATAALYCGCTHHRYACCHDLIPTFPAENPFGLFQQHRLIHIGRPGPERTANARFDGQQKGRASGTRPSGICMQPPRLPRVANRVAKVAPILCTKSKSSIRLTQSAAPFRYSAGYPIGGRSPIPRGATNLSLKSAGSYGAIRRVPNEYPPATPSLQARAPLGRLRRVPV